MVHARQYLPSKPPNLRAEIRTISMSQIAAPARRRLNTTTKTLRELDRTSQRGTSQRGTSESTSTVDPACQTTFTRWRLKGMRRREIHRLVHQKMASFRPTQSPTFLLGRSYLSTATIQAGAPPKAPKSLQVTRRVRAFSIVHGQLRQRSIHKRRFIAPRVPTRIYPS